MILPVAALLKDICEKGRYYLWPSPEVCPNCKAGRPWGHGFVLAYFDKFVAGILLRRYRCPRCGSIRLRPQGYFDRFQSSIEAIRSTIDETVERKTAARPVFAGHVRLMGAKSSKTKARAYFGDPFEHNLIAAFDRLIAMGKIPVSRSI